MPIGPIFARYELTTDPQIKNDPKLIEKHKHFDVVLYHDRECTQPACRFPWYYDTKPTKRNKTTMYNCVRYSLEWV